MTPLPIRPPSPIGTAFRFYVHTAAATDVGRTRRQNEDRLLCADALQLYGVADGVGGLPGGAEAAQRAIDTLREQVVDANATLDLAAITLAANKAVLALGSQVNPGSGIATTLTWGVFRGDCLHLAHVGDSRCHALRSGTLDCLTMDHTVANEAKAKRARGEQVDFMAAHRDAITRCIGQPSDPEIDIVNRPVQSGDRYLFCTDGISRGLTDDDIKEIMGWVLGAEHIVHGLVELANQRGGRDNATAVLVVVGATVQSASA